MEILLVLCALGSPLLAPRHALQGGGVGAEGRGSLEQQRLEATGVTAERWTAYVTKLYAAQPNEVELLPRIDEVDIIYDHMLALTAVDAGGPGTPCSSASGRPFRSRAPHSPHAAWFYHSPPFEPAPDGTWTEVTHCGGSSFEAHASWFYVARGSGLFVNVGRTHSFAHHAEAVRYFLPGHCLQDKLDDGSDGCCGGLECNDQLLKLLPEAARAANYTSLQFVHHCDLWCD